VVPIKKGIKRGKLKVKFKKIKIKNRKLENKMKTITLVILMAIIGISYVNSAPAHRNNSENELEQQGKI